MQHSARRSTHKAHVVSLCYVVQLVSMRHNAAVARMQHWYLCPPWLCFCCEGRNDVQAESLWLHLGIIKELAAMCHSVFEGGDVRYGYTTVPTYPRSALHCCGDVLHALCRSGCSPMQTCNVQLYTASDMTICVDCHQAFARFHTAANSRSCLVGICSCCLLHMCGAGCLGRKVACD